MMKNGSLLWMAVLALAGQSDARAGSPAVLQQVRQDVDSSGRLRNIELARRSGWQTMHAFAWTIELEDGAQPGVFQAADAEQRFRHGQRFRLRIEAATDLYIYVLVHNSDGTHEVLLPEKPAQVPLVKAGQTAYLPAQNAFRFSPPPGKEQLRLLASPKVLPWVEPRELWQLENGQTLTSEQQATLDQLKSVRTRSIDAAIQSQGKMKSVANILAAVKDIERGSLTRGAEVVAAEKVGQSHQVTYAGASPEARCTIVADIVLDHVE
jgi:hypothetical protein